MLVIVLHAGNITLKELRVLLLAAKKAVKGQDIAVVKSTVNLEVQGSINVYL